VGSRSLLQRHSPLVVTGSSMAFGALAYLPLGMADLRLTDWTAVSARTWGAVLFSSVFALCIAYVIWYTAVQRIGSARTSIYSNLVPVAAILIATVWLDEPLRLATLAGAMPILAGVALTKLGSPRAAAAPPEE
jgi:drug/metabolite transporter (DMT)-like permease